MADEGRQPDRASPATFIVDRAAVMVLVIASVLTLAIALPLVPTGFIPLLPVLPIAALGLFERSQLKRALRTLVNQRSPVPD